MIVNKIYDYISKEGKTIDQSVVNEVETLAGICFKKQFMTADQNRDGKLSISSAGKCPRQQAYAYHGFEKKGKEIDSRAKLVFWAGDLTELTLVSLAKTAGCCLIASGFNQMAVELKINGVTIHGHPDGILLYDGNLLLLEVKSMSSYSYERFENGYIDESYEVQINLYMEALGLTKCVFLAQNKDNGVISERIIEKKQEIVDKGKRNLLAVINSSKGNLPDAPEELNYDKKTRLYPWNCLYCSYWGHCRPNAERVLVKSSYKLKEKEDAVSSLQG